MASKGMGGKLQSVPAITGRTKGNFGSTKKALGNKIFTGPLSGRPGKSR